MIGKVFAGIFAAAILIGTPQSADAGHRGFARVPNRVINSYQRDVRQFQRQTTRSFNQFDRQTSRSFNQFDRNFRRAAPVRFAPVGFAPRSNAVFLGGSRGGIFLRF